MSALDAEYFDRWYSDLAESPLRQRIQQSMLGLPPYLLSTSLVTWDGIGEVVAALDIGHGDVLVDLACGRGGYGLEVAHRTGASLIGVDFASVAIESARSSAAHHWSTVRAEFRLGELTATGLDDDCASAAMCVDAMQFADPYHAGIAECARVLQAGGRLVLTGWQAREDSGDIPERLRHDIAAELDKAGFVDVEVHEMSHWDVAERRMWEEALEHDAADDAAMRSMQEEASRVLPTMSLMRRLLVIARAPGGDT